jgi:hypothetical protein
MKRRGSSHVEIIISFAIFLGFVSVALILFNPVKNVEESDVSVKYAMLEIERNASVKVETFSVFINNVDDSSGYPLMESNDIIQVKIAGLDSTKNIIAKIEGSTIESSSCGDFGEVCLQTNWISEKKYAIYVYSSEAFPYPSQLTSTKALADGDYILGEKITYNVIDTSKIDKLIENYDDNYPSLKEQLKISPSSEFYFNLKYEGKNIAPNKISQSSTDIFAETKRVELINKDNNIIFGDLSVELW